MGVFCFFFAKKKSFFGLHWGSLPLMHLVGALAWIALSRGSWWVAGW
jgi:hypothetical protein